MEFGDDYQKIDKVLDKIPEFHANIVIKPLVDTAFTNPTPCILPTDVKKRNRSPSSNMIQRLFMSNQSQSAGGPGIT